MTVPVLFVPHRPPTAIRILYCIRKRFADELHEREEKEETNEQYSLDMIHHVIFEGNEPIIYGLFGVPEVREGNYRKVNALTLTVLSKKFSECLALAFPFAMCSRVDAILWCVRWILDPFGSTS